MAYPLSSTPRSGTVRSVSPLDATRFVATTTWNPDLLTWDKTAVVRKAEVVQALHGPTLKEWNPQQFQWQRSSEVRTIQILQGLSDPTFMDPDETRGLPVTVWNGTTELPATLTIWNGTTEIPAWVSELAP